MRGDEAAVPLQYDHGSRPIGESPRGGEPARPDLLRWESQQTPDPGLVRDQDRWTGAFGERLRGGECGQAASFDDHRNLDGGADRPREGALGATRAWPEHDRSGLGREVGDRPHALLRVAAVLFL
jgi:hypothetical protein